MSNVIELKPRRQRGGGHIKHNKSKTRLYSIWNGMKTRCYKTYHNNYSNYGGRGIKICQEWLDDFEVFEKWALSNGYSDSLSIDRIDNDGNYEPNNCRWIPWEQQSGHRRVRKVRAYKQSYIWEINGVTKGIKDWCKEYGLSRQMVEYRVNVKGMSPYEALTTPLTPQGRGRVANGK